MLVHGKGPRSLIQVSCSVLLTAFLFQFLGISRAAAQFGASDATRRIKMAVKPEYSDLAKRLKLSGVVRVEVIVGPEGKVKRAKVLGGHPVLALDAEKAAMLTEFEPAPKETTQVIEFRIGPAN